MDIEIPLGKRKPFYRFLEILPGLLSYGAIILLVILSIFSPLLASLYLLIIILSMMVRVVGITYHMIAGRTKMDKACLIDWHARLEDLEDPQAVYARIRDQRQKEVGFAEHKENLRLIASAQPGFFPKPSEIYNAVIMPAYNESIEVIEPAIQAVIATTYDKKRMIMVFAYEERGGKDIDTTAKTLQKRYGKYFHAFHIVKHPKDIPNEVIGKGGNITHAGRWLKGWLEKQHIPYGNVIVTTMDCDNKPHETYFDYLTYEYIVREDRKHYSYQPVCLFTSNIWDVPAPMRVVATGNSFWNIISSMRPHSLRNFASHAQPMDALVEMDFWSVRTIVEDGHQYWRSYFYFGGNYGVVPLHVPIYQDAVLSATYIKTLKAQFIQFRRWAYGASDVAYVGERVFTKQRNVPFWAGFSRFVRLLDGNVTLACNSVLVAFGGWVPLIVNAEAARSVAAHQLPDTVSTLQQIALIGMAIAIFSAFKILPPRPVRYTRRRSVWMLLQWVLMPVTSIVYSSAAAFAAQTRLLVGRYLDKFDVTEKATAAINARQKAAARKRSKTSRVVEK